MSQSTRDWLLAKYTKATGCLHSMQKTITDLQQRNYEVSAELEAYKVKVYQIESELGKYKGFGDVQERLEKMSVAGHVKVWVTDCFGKQYDLNIDSVGTSGGQTTIRGHI